MNKPEVTSLATICTLLYTLYRTPATHDIGHTHGRVFRSNSCESHAMSNVHFARDNYTAILVCTLQHKPRPPSPPSTPCPEEKQHTHCILYLQATKTSGGYEISYAVHGYQTTLPPSPTAPTALAPVLGPTSSNPISPAAGSA